jgi:hypothetical protein
MITVQFLHFSKHRFCSLGCHGVLGSRPCSNIARERNNVWLYNLKPPTSLTLHATEKSFGSLCSVGVSRPRQAVQKGIVGTLVRFRLESFCVVQVFHQLQEYLDSFSILRTFDTARPVMTVMKRSTCGAITELLEFRYDRNMLRRRSSAFLGQTRFAPCAKDNIVGYPSQFHAGIILQVHPF